MRLTSDLGKLNQQQTNRQRLRAPACFSGQSHFCDESIGIRQRIEASWRTGRPNSIMSINLQVITARRDLCPWATWQMIGLNGQYATFRMILFCKSLRCLWQALSRMRQMLWGAAYLLASRSVVHRSRQKSRRAIDFIPVLHDNRSRLWILQITTIPHHGSVTELYQSSPKYVQSRRQLLNLADNRLTIVTCIISSSHTSSYQTIVDLFHFPAKLNEPYGLATTSGEVNGIRQVVKRLTTNSGEVTKWIIWVTFHFRQISTNLNEVRRKVVWVNEVDRMMPMGLTDV